MISKERLEKIKLIALDLDGTTLTRNGLTRRTAETLEEVTKRGYKVVVATGRPFVALPEKVLEIRGLEHVIISNGAHIVSVPGGEFIYSDYMDSAASLECCRILENEKFDIEVFTGGRAFVDKALYDDLEVNGSDYLSYKYILRTRRPVEGIFDFWREHSSEIENVNIYFRGPEEKARMTAVFSEVDNITVTSSMPKNIELGGATTSKATALRELCSLYGLSMEQVMAFGDNPNDLSMIEEAGIGVAMGNATDDVKSAADHIAPTSDDEGVAYTIRTMLFGEPNGLPERTSRKGKVMSKRLRNFILIVIAVVLIGAVVKLAAPGGHPAPSPPVPSDPAR